MEKIKELTEKVVNGEYKNLVGGFMDLVKNNSDLKRKGVLVLGLNPAGDEDNVKKENDPDFMYLNYIPGYRNTEVSHPKYFSPIYSMAEKILGEGNVKWDWCNRKWEDLKLEDIKDKQKVNGFYDNCQEAEYTIYIGDMFYIHETNSKNLSGYLVFKDQYQRNDYVRKMLDAHIKLLEANNVELKFIYINSAAVSCDICEALGVKPDATSCIYNGVPIFFGPMLSSGNIDKYSNSRLVNEIRLSPYKIS